MVVLKEPQKTVMNKQTGGSRCGFCVAVIHDYLSEE